MKQRPEFVTLIAVYHFLTALILILMSCVAGGLLLPLVGLRVDDPAGIIMLFLTIGIAVVLAFAIGVLFAVVGWGLLRLQAWARLMAIVLGIAALIVFPLWTIAGALVLLYLTTGEARRAFNIDEPYDQAEPESASVPDKPVPGKAAQRTIRIPASELSKHSDELSKQGRWVVGTDADDDPPEERTSSMPAVTESEPRRTPDSIIEAGPPREPTRRASTRLSNGVSPRRRRSHAPGSRRRSRVTQRKRTSDRRRLARPRLGRRRRNHRKGGSDRTR